jgi:lipooligosaccharide transport system permease protein
MGFSTVMACRMWQRNRDVFFRLWKSNLGGLLVEPLFMLVAVGFGFGSLVDKGVLGGESYGRFIAPGVIAGYAMFHSTGECTWGTFLRMVNQRTFQGILATPMSVDELITGEMLWGATKAVISCAAVLATAAAFGLVASPYAALLVPLGLLVGFMFAALSICFTAVAPSINVIESFYTLFLSPMFFFSGAFYPISAMPGPVQPVV